MIRNKKRILRFVATGLLIFLCIVFIPLVRAGVECRPFADVTPATTTGAARNDVTNNLDGYARDEGQTYLTLPEWYIVYSADEYAAFINANRPSQFPYFQAIGQYWRSYYDVCAVTREQYPFNSEYHVMLGVIGTSFTVENIIKGLYEYTVGRVTELISSSELTEEDIYARQVAKEYGDFLHTIPWYEFPFDEKLSGLWAETSLWGPNGIRKWERKVALSLEYGVKAIYGTLIKQSLAASSSPVDLEIYVWAEGLTDDILQQEPQIRLVATIDDQTSLIVVPRYEAFTKLMPRLAEQGVRFIEIAGNDEIFITAIAPRDWEYNLNEGEFLFAMEILTQPGLKRIAVKAPIKSLHTILTELDSRGIQIEHVYDY